MDTDDTRDIELVARLKRLEASAGALVPGFDYDACSSGTRRAWRARGAGWCWRAAPRWRWWWRWWAPASGGSTSAGWTRRERGAVAAAVRTPAPQPRIVRADTYLAVAALEDHIASVDDALNYARLRGGTAEVARLERTRAELIDSYTQVRYAEMVSANF